MLFKNIKKLENLHILCWLIKDSCWMLEFKWLAIFMILPTFIIAFITILLTKKTTDVFINLAVISWIVANSIWMLGDFFSIENYKYLASLFFVFGLFFMIVFFIKLNRKPLNT